MVTELGTELGTTLGTDLGSMDVFGPTFDASKLYALDSLTATNNYLTTSGGGEPGVAAGFGALELLRIDTLSVARYFFTRVNAAFSAGYGFSISGSNNLNFVIANGAGGNVFSPARALTAGDVGKVLAVIGWLDGAGNARLMVGRTQIGSGTAAVGYTAATAPTGLSGFSSAPATLPAPGIVRIGQLTFTGTPSEAQLQALSDAARSLADVPTSFVGAVVTHRWSLRETLAAPNLPIANGAAAPATIADSVAGDALAKQGTPTVRVIDPSAYPRTSYGVMGFVSGSHLKTTNAILGGTTVSLEFDVTFWSALASGKHMISNANGSGVVGGLSVYESANTLNVFSYGPGQNFSFPIASSNVGVKQTIKVECTGTVWRLYLNGTQQGADAAGTYAGSTLPLYIGCFGDTTAPADNVTVWNLKCGSYAAPQQHSYDFTSDVNANGGPQNGVPATLADRVGTESLSRVGTGLVATQRTERLWSYETTPIFQGADTLSNTNYLVSTYDDPTAAGQSFYNAFLLYMPVVTQTGYVIAGASSATLTNTGWDLRVNSNNAVVNWFMGDGTTFNVSGNAVMATGKLNLVVCVWDQINLKQRIYANRVEVGTGTGRTAYAPSGAGTKINLGRSPRDPASAGGVRTLLGYAQGLGAPTLAQVQALFDAVQATETMQGVPGMTSTLVDLTADIVANGNTLPASLTNRAGSGTFTRNGTPTLGQVFARAWAW